MILTYGKNIDDRLTKFVFDFVDKFAPVRKKDESVIDYPGNVDKYVFSIIEEDCVYVVLQGNVYNKFRTEAITVPTLAKAFEEIYDVIIDDESYKYKYNSKEDINSYKQRVKELIEEALLIEHNVIEIEDEDIENILKRIVYEMVAVTKYYNKFMSQSIEVTSKITNKSIDSFDIKFNIRFYNGGEENYNPTLYVDYHVDSKKDLLSNLQLLIDKTSQTFTDSSCGFVKLLTLVTQATIEDINKALYKIGFDNIINEDDIKSKIIHYNGKLSDLARLCAVKGIVWALEDKSKNKERFSYLIN